MYDRNFKLKFFSDITMPGELFVAQILVSKSVINCLKKLSSIYSKNTKSRTRNKDFFCGK